MNSKLLVSIVVIGLIAIAVGGAMTGAFFSDTEISTGNTFAAGSVDLKIDSQCHYNGNDCVNGLWEGSSSYPVPGTSCDCTWEAKDMEGNPVIDITDIKPGDSGESTISLHETSVPAWVCANISGIANAENGCTVPESKVDTTCGTPGIGEGELQDYLSFDIWRDYNCNNKFDGADTYLIQGAKATDVAWPIADSAHGTPVKPNDDYCIAVAWSVPQEVGNIIQTDSVIANISFRAVQSDHNPNFLCIPPQPVCGNNIIEGTEVCDGNSQSCVTGNGYGGTQACNGQCSGFGDCETTQFCGDGAINGPETCDDGIDNGQPNHCNLLCTGTTPSSCGNGVIESGETCDDGANNGQPNHCNSDCSGTTTPVCGNEVIEAGEQCDNGTDNGNVCTPPYSGSCNYCSGSCVTTTVTGPYCGDLITNGPETCDGNSQSCVTGNGYGGTQACNGQCSGFGDCETTQFCGDGAINGPETCDDGANNGQPNHCNSQCTGTTTPVCGNAVVEAGEQCDDGNQINGDGCQNDCTLTPPCEAAPDVMLVLDKSGSMDTTRFNTLKSISHDFVSALDPQTIRSHMGQTSFANNGTLDLHLTGDRTSIDAAIDAISVGDNTNLYEGLLYANQDLANPLYDRSDTTSPDYIIVITDGTPNRPTSIAIAESLAKAQADAADAAGTKIYVVGIGVSTTGANWLKTNIATGPAYYYNSTNYTDLSNILENIENCR